MAFTHDEQLTELSHFAHVMFRSKNSYDKTLSAYNLKHVAERWTGCYSTMQEFEQILQRQGFGCEKQGYCISSRSPAFAKYHGQYIRFMDYGIPRQEWKYICEYGIGSWLKTYKMHFNIVNHYSI